MNERWYRIANLTGIFWLFALAVAISIGCAANPLLSLNFVANTLDQFNDPDGPAGGGGDPIIGDPGAPIIGSVCDLDAEKRGFFITVRNESQQFAQLSLTFAVSAGGAGFVCDDEVPIYFNAGYRTAMLVDNITFVGCDPIRLFSGDRILTLRITDTLGPNPGGNPDTATIAQPPLNGSSFIPLPEIIVLGDETPNFVCTGVNLCTQRGFIYTDVANNPIAFVNASRTQDTVCNANAGALPEWRLGDPNIDDFLIQPFQYPAGGTLRISILDRASNVNPNVNQVVWQVFDVDGNLIHDERR